MTDDQDRISRRPSAITNGSLTESGRAGLSLNPSASLPARPDSPTYFPHITTAFSPNFLSSNHMYD
jgi:hypothetical protein